MAKLARRALDHEGESDGHEELTADFVHRWVEVPSGRMKLQEFPLTPDYFLDPQIGDQVVQSYRHWRVTGQLQLRSGPAAGGDRSPQELRRLIRRQSR
jgi:hypothetical protein